jgi:RHS repeat-associated protein
VYGQTTQTTLSGTPSDNSQQYTGRENDGTGLMYYRARYYHAGCARFISEDPIGWASGQTNNYAYVGGDPVSNIDPSGLKSIGQCAIEHYGLEDFFGDGNGDAEVPAGVIARGVVAAGAIPIPKALSESGCTREQAPSQTHGARQVCMSVSLFPQAR